MRLSRRSLLQSFGATAFVGSAAQICGPIRPGAPIGTHGFKHGKSVTNVAADAQPLQGANSPSYPILLDQNENAYGPSKKALAVFRDAPHVSNRYPRTEYESLISKIAARHEVKPDQIALGCGSTEILRLAAAEFLGPGKRLVQTAPTCPLLGGFARSVGAEVDNVPVTKRYEHDLDAMLASAGDSAHLVYICNPNSPTGTLTQRKDIETFISKLPAKTMVLVDEAYHDYVSSNGSDASLLDPVLDDPRVMVTRTFSAIYGLAGMRVGYVVAAPEIARRISAGLHLGISAISAKAAAAALDDSEYVRLSAQRNADDRQEFMNQVNGRFLHAVDSHTNFVMLNPMRPTDHVIEHFKNNKIIIGPIVQETPKYLRVSISTPADMKEFWRVMDMLPGGGKMVM